jgi:hypothetical protein
MFGLSHRGACPALKLALIDHLHEFDPNNPPQQ